jgi:MOSC domain-containing protein YiiM
MAKILTVCTSNTKGTRKKDVGEGVLRKNYGLIGDAHSDSETHRQVSLLAMDSIEKMRGLGLNVGPGDFAENFTTEGMELISLPVGTCIAVGDESVLEITQIGKECHTRCAIYYQAGQCVMPEEGVFARVVSGGRVKSGDIIKIIKKND